MAKSKGNQPLKDWVYIEELFRAGHSYRAIRFRYLKRYPDQTLAIETIRRKAKRLKWKKDLKDKIRKAADRKLAEKTRDEAAAREKPGEPDGRTDEEIIDEAAEEAARVVMSHREDGRNLRRLVAKLANELEMDPKQVVMRKTSKGTTEIEIPIPLKEKTRSVKDLSLALAKAVSIERISHNLDDRGAGSTGSIEVTSYIPEPFPLPDGI